MTGSISHMCSFPSYCSNPYSLIFYDKTWNRASQLLQTVVTLPFLSFSFSSFLYFTFLCLLLSACSLLCLPLERYYYTNRKVFVWIHIMTLPTGICIRIKSILSAPFSSVLSKNVSQSILFSLSLASLPFPYFWSPPCLSPIQYQTKYLENFVFGRFFAV